MKSDFIKKFILPPGPILGLILAGMLLLSAVLYYRAVKIQRFLEPALAISQPRNEFARSINSLLLKEFGTEEVRGIRFKTGSIFVEESLLFDNGNSMKESAYTILKKLGHVFMSALNDSNTRAHIDLILVSATFPVNPDTKRNSKMRIDMQHKAELILYSMYKSEPELEKNYGTYLAATALPVSASAQETSWVEFRIIPTELVHIEMLLKLGKYTQR
ncbi:MAG: hypothetical protein Q7T83_07825 [Thermodesulfovibrionales bacterium]|nr:hypothetical protein [Thermodesulfovibrionales bacterium]